MIVILHSPGYPPTYTGTSSYVANVSPTSSTTMGFLSLCADSGRPPGMTMLLEPTDGQCITMACESCETQQCNTAPNLHRVSYSHVTAYYATQAAHNPSPTLHLPSQSSLHVISALTCTNFPLAHQPPPTPLIQCTCFNTQWPPESPMNSNIDGTPLPHVKMNTQAPLPNSLAPATLWLPQLCFILMATCFTPWLMLLQWNINPILTTRRRRRQRRQRRR